MGVSPANENVTDITLWEEIQETMMLGLRLTQQGIGDGEFKSRFGNNMESLFTKEIDSLLHQELLEWGILEGDRILRLTRKGRMLGNRVFCEFVGNRPPKDFR